MSPAACSCGATLAPDQRHCLACGAPTPLGSALRDGLWRGARTPAPAVPVATPTRLALLPLGGELSLKAATLAFAIVLGTGAWAGARVTTPAAQAAPAYALAPAAAAPAPSTPPAPTADGSSTARADVADDSADATVGTDEPLADAALPTPATTSDDAATTDDATTTSDAAATTDEPAGTTPAEAAATTPALERVVVVALPPLAYDALVDPAGAAPYLAGTLVPKGALVRSFHGAAPTALASGVALLSGQAPNSATLAGCPADGELLPGTIGDDDQAAGAGCRYPQDVFTVGDLLASTDRSWRVYVEDAAAARCDALTDGTPWPAGRPAALAFHSVTDDPACAQRIAPLAQLHTDLAATKTAPALAYVELSGCGADGSCITGSPAAIDASLRALVPMLQATLAPVKASAVLIVPAHAPQDGVAPDRAACCSDRPWLAGDAAQAGGGRTGALVLSPLVKAGTVLDEAVDQYDLLKTISEALAVRPLGLAARAEVHGLPRETWGRWKP